MHHNYQRKTAKVTAVQFTGLDESIGKIGWLLDTLSNGKNFQFTYAREPQHFEFCLGMRSYLLNLHEWLVNDPVDGLVILNTREFLEKYE